MIGGVAASNHHFVLPVGYRSAVTEQKLSKQFKGLDELIWARRVHIAVYRSLILRRSPTFSRRYDRRTSVVRGLDNE
jgi:hypothetical protein